MGVEMVCWVSVVQRLEEEMPLIKTAFNQTVAMALSRLNTLDWNVEMSGVRRPCN
jgi:hypothetical protein